jgi:hypothetical protein
MPVMRGVFRGFPFYKWGKHGHRYFYIVGDAVRRKHAKMQAIRQGIAIKMNQRY